MVNLKYKAYSVTIRPKNGLLDEDIELCMKVLRKNCKGWKFITEKDGPERHAHIACYLNQLEDYSQWKRKWKVTFEKVWKDRGDGTIFNVAYKHGAMYNEDWMNKYLEKGDGTVMIDCMMPENHMEYYMDVKRKEESKVRIVDEYYNRLELLWYEHRSSGDPNDGRSVADFLCEMMFNKRVIRVIADKRKRHQTADALSAYLNKACYDSEYQNWQ